MTGMTHLFAELLNDEWGQDLIEYALLGGVVALAAIASVKAVASNVAGSFSSLGSQLTSAI